MASKEENSKMASRMREDGPGRWPNSVHLQPSYGWRGVGFDDRMRALKTPKDVNPSGKNELGMLGGVLAARMGFKSPIDLPIE